MTAPWHWAPADDWGWYHAKLDEALDTIESRDPAWPDMLAVIALRARDLREYPNTRWKGTGTDFAVETHHDLDRALRQDPEIRDRILDDIARRCAVKWRHQDAFAAMVDELAVATRALRVESGGHLEPDVADPIVALRDALAGFSPRLAKVYLRELLRADKYYYQATDTRGNPTLLRFQAALDGPDFAQWVLDTDAASCGAIAQGHPERDTWYLEDAA